MNPSPADPSAPGFLGPAPAVEVFVAPSREAQRLQALLPSLVAPRTGGVAREVRDALVAPFTQLTFVSFDLQWFLFEVFHTSLLARVGHLVGMAGVNLSLMAGFGRLTAGFPVDGGAIYALVLCAWYGVVARKAGLLLWWVATAPVLVALWAGAQACLAATEGVDSFAASPWLWMALSALGVSVSHAGEPLLPPRAGDPLRWLPVVEFVRGPAGARLPLRVAARRAARLCAYPFIGALDELWASPRLLPYNVLAILFACGYAPERRAVLRDRSRRALASGQPALDFVGIGGGATLPSGP